MQSPSSSLFNSNLIKFVAIILITNSHLDPLYPDPRYATGGSLGNALFFALAGFGLALSSRVHLPKFGEWMRRRLLRIYPQVFIVLLAGGVITSTIHWLPIADMFRKFIWPTPYWFVASIVIFYVPLYFMLRFSPKKIPTFIALSAAPYFWFYATSLDLDRFSLEDEYFRWLFYFPVMLFGAHIASTSAIHNRRASDAPLLGLTIAGYFGLKIVISKGILGDWQFLIHLLTFYFVFYSFRFLSNPTVLDALHKYRIYFWVVALGELSLEVYLVQVYWIKGVAGSGIYAPWGAIIIWPLVFATAWLVSISTKQLVGRLAPDSKPTQASASSGFASKQS